MNTLTLLEWNLHKMTHSAPVPPFVCRRILSPDPDLICLVEYRTDPGIRAALKNAYWVAESIPASGNQILLAVRRTLAPKGIQVVRRVEEPGCFNLLHICFSYGEKRSLSLLGVRMLSPMDASQQTSPLNRYLSQLDGPFLCTGDFNILGRRMPVWFPSYPKEVSVGTGPLARVSYLYSDSSGTVTGVGDPDHTLCSPGLTVRAQYQWDFTSDDPIYPNPVAAMHGGRWDLPPGFPDHAILWAQVRSSGKMG